MGSSNPGANIASILHEHHEVPLKRYTRDVGAQEQLEVSSAILPPSLRTADAIGSEELLR